MNTFIIQKGYKNFIFILFLTLLSFSCVKKHECNSCGKGKKKTIAEFKMNSFEYKIAIQSILHEEYKNDFYYGTSQINESFFSELLNELVQKSEFETKDAIAATVYLNKKLSNYVIVEPTNIIAFSLYRYLNDTILINTFVEDGEYYTLLKSNIVSGIELNYHTAILDELNLPDGIKPSFITFYGDDFSLIE